MTSRITFHTVSLTSTHLLKPHHFQTRIITFRHHDPVFRKYIDVSMMHKLYAEQFDKHSSHFYFPKKGMTLLKSAVEISMIGLKETLTTHIEVNWMIIGEEMVVRENVRVRLADL